VIDTSLHHVGPQPPERAECARNWVDLLGMLTSCGRRLRNGLAQQLVDATFNEAEFWLLWACHSRGSKGELNQNELATQLGMSAAHVSQLVEQLRQRGWLEGHRAARDRRRQCWQITAEGIAQLDAALQQLADWIGRLANEFRGEDQRALEASLSRLESAAVRDSQRGSGREGRE